MDNQKRVTRFCKNCVELEKENAELRELCSTMSAGFDKATDKCMELEAKLAEVPDGLEKGGE